MHSARHSIPPSRQERRRRVVRACCAWGALILLPHLADTALAAQADDAVPEGVFVLPRAEWVDCPAASAARPVPAARCPSLAIDFRADLPKALEAAIAGTPQEATRDWIVQAVRPVSGSTDAPVTLSVARVDALPGLTGLVRLVLAEQSGTGSATADYLDAAKYLLVVTYKGPNGPAVVTTRERYAAAQQPGDGAAPATRPSLLVKVKDPDNPDLYFAGKAKAARGSGPVFSFEARVQRPFWTIGENQFGAVAEVVAEEQGNVDPDSIKAGVSYSRILDASERIVRLSAVPFGGEFSRSDPVTAGMLSGADVIWTFVPSWRTRLSIQAVGGLEAGSNLKNAIDEDGSGAIFRVKGGLNLVARLDRMLGLKKMTLTGAWIARGLGRREIDPERVDPAERPTLTRRTRHRLTADLEAALNDFLGLSIQFRRGPLPPAFESLKPTVSVSLVYKADWRISKK